MFLKQKTQNIINDTIHILHLLEEKENIDDIIFERIFNYISSMLYNLTKLYSFFLDSKWNIDDVELILKFKEKGFESLKNKYKNS